VPRDLLIDETQEVRRQTDIDLSECVVVDVDTGTVDSPFNELDELPRDVVCTETQNRFLLSRSTFLNSSWRNRYTTLAIF